jgi:hypothetical protein
VKPLYSGLLRPNGLAFKNGTLYIAELNKILKVEKIEDNLENPPKPIVIYDDLPSDEAHGWKYLTFGPDDKLYFQVGAPCNICEPSDRHAQIRRINTDGSGVDVIARGIRQILGMDFHPVSKQLYFSENQRDWLSEELPNDKLNRLTQPGKEFRNIGDPRRRDRFMSTYELGVRSPFVVHGIAAYERAFKMLEDTLSEAGPWILGAGPSLADINLMPFAARLDYLGLLPLWIKDRPRMIAWWNLAREWPSFKTGLRDLISEAEFSEMRMHGPKIANHVAEIVAEVRRGTLAAVH